MLICAKYHIDASTMPGWNASISEEVSHLVHVLIVIYDRIAISLAFYVGHGTSNCYQLDLSATTNLRISAHTVSMCSLPHCIPSFAAVEVALMSTTAQTAVTATVSVSFRPLDCSNVM